MTLTPRFKRGDRVRVVRNMSREWTGWVPPMDYYVNDGKIYKVASVEDARFSGQFLVRVVNGNNSGWNFPEGALAPAELRS